MKNLRNKIKNKKGITLIALIITIIVLLILAGVVINMTIGEQGIISKAQNAVDKYKVAQEEEESMIAKIEAEMDNYTEGKSYTEGDEVTVGGEQFFVLKDNGSTVTLISKYNLNQAGTKQQNAPEETTECVFSSEYYWKDSWDTWYNELFGGVVDDSIDYLNLNNESGYATGDAIDKAKKYGKAKGGTGRLLTYEEVKDIFAGDDEKLQKIIAGQDYDSNPVDEANYLVYWLDTADRFEKYMFIIYGDFITWDSDQYDGSGGMRAGVRPVIEIAKSKIS